MKILHLEFGRHVYGGPIQVVYLVQGLSEISDIENHVVVPLESDLDTCFPEDAEVTTHKIAIGGEADFRVYFRLRALIRRVQPDVLHIHSRRGADSWGILAARHENLPFILTRRVDNVDAAWLTRWRTRKASFVVGISRRICEVMREGGADPRNLRCVLDTVDTQAYRPGGDKRLLAEVTGTSPETPRIAIIAQLIERKGHRILFEAIPGILEHHPDAVFLVFGKGPLEESLKKRVAAEPWSGQLRFMGFRTDLDRLLPSLDLVVHPAFMEGMGVSLLQASACGVPIVASKAGGIPEVVDDGVNGFLVEPGNPSDLANRVNELLGDPRLRQQMAQAGRDIALERFSIRRMAVDYLDLYRQSIKNT